MLPLFCGKIAEAWLPFAAMDVCWCNACWIARGVPRLLPRLDVDGAVAAPTGAFAVQFE